MDSKSASPATSSPVSISVPRDSRKRTGIELYTATAATWGTRQHGSIAWPQPRGHRSGYLLLLAIQTPKTKPVLQVDSLSHGKSCNLRSAR